MDSNPDNHQKTNIVSGCPRHLDIQKELGWDLVPQGTSAGSWVRLLAHPKRTEMSSRRPAKGEKPLEKVVCIPKENWSGVQETSIKLRRGWSLRMIPALWLSSLNDLWQNDLEDWWTRKVTIFGGASRNVEFVFLWSVKTSLSRIDSRFLPHTARGQKTWVRCSFESPNIVRLTRPKRM